MTKNRNPHFFMVALKNPSFFKNLVLPVACLLIWSTTHSQAQDQPKPGPDQKKLQTFVGEWTYEGTGVASPLLEAAGKFKGKLTARMILSGFFLETHSEDTSDNGYVYQGTNITGYDSAKKSYVAHHFENDGSSEVSELKINDHTWTIFGSRGAGGKTYATRTVLTFSADGRSMNEEAAYSEDGGKSWKPWYQATMTRISK